MAKKSNHRTVVFLQDFGTKKASEEWACDGMIASSIVNRGIAEYKKEVAIEADDAPFTLNILEPIEQDTDIKWEEDVHYLGEAVNTIQMDGIELHESESEFKPLPEITEENSGEEKVSEPIETPGKQKSSSKPKNKK